MAVMVPFLVVGMMGFLDLGRAFYYQISLTNAVREAARYASQNTYYGLNPSCSPPPSPPGSYCPVPIDSDIRARVNQELGGTGFTVDPTHVTVTPSQGTRMTQFGNQVQYTVTVDATYDFHFITPLIGSLIGDPLTLHSSADMRTDY
jgi:Flp pilus assembly protein TadG